MKVIEEKGQRAIQALVEQNELCKLSEHSVKEQLMLCRSGICSPQSATCEGRPNNPDSKS